MLLEMEHVTKRFGELVANRDVSLSVRAGEVHALLGENGAGKTTLMNILSGMYAADEGVIRLNGEKIVINNARDAIAKGIGMVHQHFMLVPALTVIENVVLGLKENKHFLDLRGAAARLNELGDKFGLAVDPWAKVADLSIGQQQRVEILKALYRDAQLLILDEPTAVLTPQEVESLFAMIRTLTQEGLTIIFISHKLMEILGICDRCTVLRRGEVVQTIDVADITDKQHLANMMVGRQVDLHVQKPRVTPGDEVLKLDDICYTDKDGARRVKNVSFAIRQREILGICGIDGSGQSQLVECITGLAHATQGSVTLNGKPSNQMPTREILRHGVSHIPEDRHRMAMVGQLSINENLLLMTSARKDFLCHGLYRWKAISTYNQKLCEDYQIKAQGVSEPMTNLSGGNQQKVIVAREMDRHPNLLIAMHPNRGLDIGSTKYIQGKIVEARNNGAAVLLVSGDLEEIMDLSDRIAVMYNGRIMAVMPQQSATIDKLGLLMAGVMPEGMNEHIATNGAS